MQRRCQNAVWFALAILLAIGWSAVIWRTSNIPHPPINQSATAQKDHQPKSETIEERHQTTEEAIAYYNKWLMFFTAILAVATLGLGVATVGLYFAGERQLKFIRDEFVTTHRPRLRVRHVALLPDASPIDTVIMFGHGTTMEGALSVVNVGGSDARIIRSTYRIYFSKNGLPMRSPLNNGIAPLIEINTIIKRGESKVLFITDIVDMGPTDDSGLRDIRQYVNEGWKAYIMGEIRYQDDGGADHFMGFCRERQSDGRLRAVDDPDYEYED